MLVQVLRMAHTMHITPVHPQVAPDNIARALKVTKGALIQTVDPNSAAAKAGLLATRRGLSGIVPGGMPGGVCRVGVWVYVELVRTVACLPCIKER